MPIYGGTRRADVGGSTDMTQVESYLASIEVAAGSFAYSGASISFYDDKVKNYETGKILSSGADGSLLASEYGYTAKQPVNISADGAGGVGVPVVIVAAGTGKVDVEFYMVASITGHYYLPFAENSGAPAPGNPDWFSGGPGAGNVEMDLVAGVQYGPFHFMVNTAAQDFCMAVVGGATAWPAGAGIVVWCDWRDLP